MLLVHFIRLEAPPQALCLPRMLPRRSMAFYNVRNTFLHTVSRLGSRQQGIGILILQMRELKSQEVQMSCHAVRDKDGASLVSAS